MQKQWPTTQDYSAIKELVTASEEGRDLVEWVQNLRRPTDPEEMAETLIFVVIASGFRYETARDIWERVKAALRSGTSVYPNAFGHEGKAQAIESIWRDRETLFAEFSGLADDEVLEWCAHLPWIGPTTKFQAARDLGVPVAKPDVWLLRIQERAGEEVQELCARLARETGDDSGTVDLVLWYAASHGMIAGL